MKKELVNQPVNIKLKLALLWAAVMCCYFYGDYFELYVPGKVEGLIKGNNNLNTPMNLLIATIALVIPALMIVVSVFSKPNVNRILNIISGIFFTLVMLVIGYGSISEWYAFYVLLAVIECILTVAIVWQAWNWPRETAGA